MTHPSPLTSKRKAELYDHMKAVAEANGFESLTDAITRAVKAEASLLAQAERTRQLEEENERQQGLIGQAEHVLTVAYGWEADHYDRSNPNHPWFHDARRIIKHLRAALSKDHPHAD